MKEQPDRVQQPAARQRILIPAALVLCSLLGAVLLLYFTRNGAGASGDATLYVQGALNLLAGRGYSRLSGGGEAIPITGFPPGFPVVLAASGLLGGNLFANARLINVVFYALTIFGTGWITWRVSRSGLAAILASLLVLSAPNLLKVYSWVMSEGLFIVLILAGLAFFLVYLEKASRLVLVGASLAIMAATLTRYVGLSLAAAFCLVILLVGKKSLSQRLADCALVAAVVLLPFIAWLQRNAALAGTMTNRSINYHPMSPALVVAFLQEMAAWFIPRQVPFSLTVKGLILIILALIVAGIFLWRTHAAGRDGVLRPAGQSLCLTLSLALLAYFVVLVLNTTFLDSSTSIEAAARYLTPVFVMSVILGVSVLAALLPGLPFQRAVSILAVTIGLAIIFIYGYRTVGMIRQPGALFGYTDYRQANPDLVSALAGLDKSRLLISNNVELTYFLSGRPAYAMPILFDHYTQKYRDDYQDQLARAEGRLDAGAVIVIYGSSDEEEQDLLSLLEVKPFGMFKDVTLYDRQ